MKKCKLNCKTLNLDYVKNKIKTKIYIEIGNNVRTTNFASDLMLTTTQLEIK